MAFDRDFSYIDGGFQPLSSAPLEQGQNVPHEQLSAQAIVKTAGYVYVYVSNEGTTMPYEVYFDDLSVEHIKAPIIQADDYYPFGLAFNSYQRENSVRNSYLYNGKEEQDELGLEWMDYGARMYSPEIGRWQVLDPMSEKYLEFTPYAYVVNNPMKFIDPNGMEIYMVLADGSVVAANDANLKNKDIYQAYQGVVSTEIGKQLWDMYANNDKKDIYLSMSDKLATPGATINDLTLSNLDQDDDGKADDVLKIDGFEGFVGVDMSQSKDKEIALVSLNSSFFGESTEGQKFNQAETLFHEIKAHSDIDDSSPGDQGKNHKEYGAWTVVNNWGQGSISADSPAGKFVQQLLNSNTFKLPPWQKKEFQGTLRKGK